jgi:spore germination protein KC
MEGGTGGGEAQGGGTAISAIGGAALFDGDRLVGFAEELEARGLRWALAPVANQSIWVPVDGRGGFATRVSQTWPRLTVEESQGRLHLRIHVEVEGDVTELRGSVDSDSLAAMAELEALAARRIEADIAAGVAYAELLQSDPLRVGLSLSRWHPALWRRLRDDWPRALADAVHLIEVDVRIITAGILGRNAPVGRTQTGTGP